MIVYVRFGVLVRCVLCAAVITFAVAAALLRPPQHDPAPPATPSTSEEEQAGRLRP